jgi:hypothetical protein
VISVNIWDRTTKQSSSMLSMLTSRSGTGSTTAVVASGGSIINQRLLFSSKEQLSTNLQMVQPELYPRIFPGNISPRHRITDGGDWPTREPRDLQQYWCHEKCSQGCL